MGLFPPMSFTAGSIGANTAKLVMDMGGWDKLFQLAVERGLVPATPTGKLGTIGALFLIGAFTDWKLGESTVGSKFLKEVLSDVPSEFGARILTSPVVPQRVITLSASNTSIQRRPLAQAITDGMNEITARLRPAKS